MEKKHRFQIIKKQITSTSAHTITADLDKHYKKVTGIWMYADPIYADNTNLVLSSPLKINNVEHLPVDFDTALLFPIDHNSAFTEILEDAAGSQLEVSVTDSGYSSDYYFTIIVKLENPEDNE